MTGQHCGIPTSPGANAARPRAPTGTGRQSRTTTSGRSSTAGTRCARVGVWATGALLYEMLVRRTPFEDPSMAAALVIDDPPADPLAQASQTGPEPR